MRLSIALCTYNGKRFMGDHLASYATQTHLPDEVVVCDDGLTDRTVSTVGSLPHLIPLPVRLYRNQSRLKYGGNFEKAASLSEREVILFSDQNDV